MTTNLKERIFTVIVGVGISVSAIVFLPHHHYLLFCMLMCFASFLGSFEMSKMLFNCVEPIVFFSWLLPFTQYIVIEFSLHDILVDLILVFEFFCLFTSEIFIGEKDNFKSSLIRTAKSCLIVIYPSFFMSYLVKVAGIDVYKSNMFLLYFILVYTNDTSAYVFGMLFGKNNAGIIKASPKKSIAGFVGSLISTVLVSVFLATFAKAIWARIVLGIFICFTANVGDLIESVFKRSANIKDSGKVFPGRGGMLDCMDSVCAAGPIYYLLLRIIMEFNL